MNPIAYNVATLIVITAIYDYEHDTCFICDGDTHTVIVANDK